MTTQFQNLWAPTGGAHEVSLTIQLACRQKKKKTKSE